MFQKAFKAQFCHDCFSDDGAITLIGFTPSCAYEPGRQSNLPLWQLASQQGSLSMSAQCALRSVPGSLFVQES